MGEGVVASAGAVTAVASSSDATAKPTDSRRPSLWAAIYGSVSRPRSSRHWGGCPMAPGQACLVLRQVVVDKGAPPGVPAAVPVIGHRVLVGPAVVEGDHPGALAGLHPGGGPVHEALAPAGRADVRGVAIRVQPDLVHDDGIARREVAPGPVDAVLLPRVKSRRAVPIAVGTKDQIGIAQRICGDLRAVPRPADAVDENRLGVAGSTDRLYVEPFGGLPVDPVGAFRPIAVVAARLVVRLNPDQGIARIASGEQIDEAHDVGRRVRPALAELHHHAA